jgi:hypothetical protein
VSEFKIYRASGGGTALMHAPRSIPAGVPKTLTAEDRDSAERRGTGRWVKDGLGRDRFLVETEDAAQAYDEAGNLVEVKRIIDDPGRPGGILTLGLTADGCRYIVQGNRKPRTVKVLQRSWADEDIEDAEIVKETVTVRRVR